MLPQNETVIAVEAPRASFIEVPDPDEVGIWIFPFHKLRTHGFLISIVPRTMAFVRSSIDLL